MEHRITVERLSAIAETERKRIRSEGGFPKRHKYTSRSNEKEEALFILRLNASVKYGIIRFSDGTFRLQQK
jgi:hypothetical protein